jgi:hypothetical protein
MKQRDGLFCFILHFSGNQKTGTSHLRDVPIHAAG